MYGKLTKGEHFGHFDHHPPLHCPWSILLFADSNHSYLLVLYNYVNGYSFQTGSVKFSQESNLSIEINLNLEYLSLAGQHLKKKSIALIFLNCSY